MNIYTVIPVYNNAKTIREVVKECLLYSRNVLVVDDGSTDADLREMFKGTSVEVIRHEVNKGKGAALLTALNYLNQKDVDYMITIDGDGQHYPCDIPKFISIINELEPTNPCIIVGVRDFGDNPNITNGSRFGRRFSNMWVRIETGYSCADSQSGFRAYPVKYVSIIELKRKRYDFEIEILTRSLWGGIGLKHVDISVHYPKPEERISFFDPLKDNLLLTLLHTHLVCRALLPIPYKRIISKNNHPVNIKEILKVKNIKHLLRELLKENNSPMGLAASAAVGTYLAVFPLIAMHTISILYVTTRLHLNKILAVAIQNLYAPPFVPLICAEIGHLIRTGKFLTHITFADFKSLWHLIFWDYILGAVVAAPFFSVAAGLVVYFVTFNIKNKTK